MTNTDADAIADEIVELWVYFAIHTCTHAQPPLDQPGGRDWLQIRLVEEFRGGLVIVVVNTLESPDASLPLTVAVLCVRDIIRACNEAFAPIAVRVATAAAAGEDVVFKVATAAIEEAKRSLLQQVSLAIERAMARG